jgi:hypothetical protein
LRKGLGCYLSRSSFVRDAGELPVSASDWIIDILLVALVLRQVRPRHLTPRAVLLPAVLLVIAGSEYLKAFPTGGNDLLMDLVLVAAGAVFGVVSGLTTKVWRDPDGKTMCRAGVAAAAAWILGMGIRMAFDVWAHTASGGQSLVHFSVHHSISTANAYATAFVLMAFAQVGLRVGLLQVRRLRSERVPAPSMS